MASNQSIFDQLNLSSGERRLVMVVVLGFVIVLAIAARGLVPDPGETNNNMAAAEKELASFQVEIGRKDQYLRSLGELKKMGSEVLPIEQEFTMRGAINQLVASSGLSMKSMRSSRSSFGEQTNRFFMEKAMQLQFSSKEDQLVDFLWKLGSGDSMIRVSAMQINPEKSGQRLTGSLTLTASYQKPSVSGRPAPRAASAKPVAARPAPAPARTVASASAGKAEVKKAASKPSPKPVEKPAPSKLELKKEAPAGAGKPGPSPANKAAAQPEKRTRKIPSRPVRTAPLGENRK